MEAAYGPFQQGQFEEVKALLRGVPGRYLDVRTKVKVGIAGLPRPVANTLRGVLGKAA